MFCPVSGRLVYIMYNLRNPLSEVRVNETFGEQVEGRSQVSEGCEAHEGRERERAAAGRISSLICVVCRRYDVMGYGSACPCVHVDGRCAAPVLL